MRTTTSATAASRSAFPIATKRSSASGSSTGECEFTHMRYSTVTGPDNFEDNSSMLCQVHCNPQRWTEQFVVMAMYSEDDTLFARTMHGVMKNIVSMQARSQQDLGQGRLGGGRRLHRQGWPPEDQFAHAGRHQGSIATNMVNGKPVSAHIVAVAEPNKIEDAEREIVLVQIIFCLKEKNQKKINSYHWSLAIFSSQISVFFSTSG